MFGPPIFQPPIRTLQPAAERIPAIPKARINDCDNRGMDLILYRTVIVSVGICLQKHQTVIRSIRENLAEKKRRIPFPGYAVWLIQPAQSSILPMIASSLSFDSDDRSQVVSYSLPSPCIVSELP
jgi:hypothetical protein